MGQHRSGALPLLKRTDTPFVHFRPFPARPARSSRSPQLGTVLWHISSVLVQKHPEMVRQLWAYQTMVVWEARRCGGNGWQAYDTMFRQQVAHSRAVDWSKLNNTLYAVTFLVQQLGKGKTCGGSQQGRCSECSRLSHVSADRRLLEAHNSIKTFHFHKYVLALQ